MCKISIASQSRLEQAEQALKECNTSLLVEILEKEDFRGVINPAKLSMFDWYQERLRRERDLEVTGFKKYTFDRTDHIEPYLNGFIRTNKNFQIAAYGIIENIFIHRLIRLDLPHHFFFISFPEESALTNLINKSKESMMHPLYIYLSRKISSLFHNCDGNKKRGLFHQYDLGPEFGLRGLRNYFKEKYYNGSIPTQ